MEATGGWCTAGSQGTKWNSKIDIFSVHFLLLQIGLASVLWERTTGHPPGLNVLQGNWESRDVVSLLFLLLLVAVLFNKFFNRCGLHLSWI